MEEKGMLTNGFTVVLMQMLKDGAFWSKYSTLM